MSLAKGIGGALGWRAGQHGGVTDLLWDDVKYFLDPDLMGPLPDVRVPNASVEDWQAVLNLVAEKGWKCQYSGGWCFRCPGRRPSARTCGSGQRSMCWRSSVSMPAMKSTSTLRELHGQDRLDVFCGFLREIGRRLGKPMLMDPEGDCGHPVLGFDIEADRASQSRWSGD